ncbi:galactose mutarotase [Caerostris darwini]|uniref:Aldose 1-epimerase n=1 Tax=Caerostris darwini TaxID=1538125 RepID=A0AAV4WXQ1_9ARAC|nr:galactose mutarotase [Caerostris darwini]
MSISIRTDCFGEIQEDGGTSKKVTRFTMSNESIEVQIIDYGACITSLKVPDKSGKMDDIVMGFDTIEEYINHPYYFGCTVGRYANRIAKGEFVLDDEKHSLAINNGPNHLHGGLKGFDKVIWDSTVEGNKVILFYTSPSMEENYPGELKCYVIYELTEGNEIIIDYEATTTEKTPINLTNHSYFNLAGHGSGPIYDQIISLNADYYTPVDETLIPTGNIVPVTSTHFDLREPKRLGTLFEINPDGFDHNFCVNGELGIDRKVARVHHPESGRCMEVHSTQPGVQFYTANFLPEDDTLCGKEGKYYKKHGAFCLETQNYPDAVNQVNFPNAFLSTDEVYNHTTRLSFLLK